MPVLFDSCCCTNRLYLRVPRPWFVRVGSYGLKSLIILSALRTPCSFFVSSVLNLFSPPLQSVLNYFFSPNFFRRNSCFESAAPFPFFSFASSISFRCPLPPQLRTGSAPA